jgi:hypothetical protein
MNRKQLDAFVEQHGLSPAAIAAAFELTHAVPSAAEIRWFVARLLLIAGVLSLGAALVFFIAANWEALAILGRFALVETALIAALGVALWRPPPHAIGRGALLLAFVAAGALLALFGQTYQTGADVYELFLSWAAVGFVIVVAGQWSVTWAAWVLVLNVALALFSGWRAESGWLFALFFGWSLNPGDVMAVAMLVDVVLWAAMLALRSTTAAPLAPPWLGRVVLTGAVGFATAAGIAFIVDDDASAWSGLLVGAVLAGLAIYTLRRRDDLFPLALVAASGIALTTVALGRYSGLDDVELFLALALWLIVSSTLAGHWLMKAVRAWRVEALPE